MEVGEYIRTKGGCIGNIININEFRPPEAKICVDMNLSDYVFISEDEIVKHSKKPIELVQAGDIVEIQNKLDGNKSIFNLNEYIIGIYKEQIENGSIKLTSILTLEMYEQNCYKVGVENE